MQSKHPNLSDQREAITWARKVLKNKHKYVILDTETTGIGKKDEIIEMAIIDLDGNSLFWSRFLPIKRKSIPKDATAIHGISYAMLKDYPRFSDFDGNLRAVINNKDIIAYNAEYDMRLYIQTYLLAQQHEGRKIFAPKGDWYCAMQEYAKFVGDWDNYHNNYRWHKLQSQSNKADHSSHGDCLATLEVIRKMANAPLRKSWHEFWKFWISEESK